MKVSDIFTSVLKTAKSNSPEILTALAVSGVVTTSYLTAKASFKAKKALDEDTRGQMVAGVFYKAELTKKETVKTVWKHYIPAGISGVLTVGCIVGASKASGRRTTAAVAAYSITERAFAEYKEKVVEQIGKGKEEKIRDEIAQDRVTKNPKSQEVVILGGGQVLCCELYTHRYFMSDMETLRKAQNDVNALVISELYVSVNELYDVIGLPHTSKSANLGWNSDKLMEMIFSTVLSEDNEPCLAFDYNYIRPLK